MDRQIKFVNELGNQIEISVTEDDRGITIIATGPTSVCEDTWTPLEAAVLRDLLMRMDSLPK